MSRRRRDTATYLYCVVQSPKPPALAGAPAGLPRAGAPRLLGAADSIWLVVADAPLARYSGPAIERGLRDLAWVSACAVGHEAVVEHVARRASVIPMKLFTLFLDDERALAHVLENRERLERLFERVAGRDEWVVRALLDPRQPRERRAPRAARSGQAPSGTAFLLARQRARDAARREVDEARAEARRAADALARLAIEARPGGTRGAEVAPGLLEEAALLVDRRRRPAFQRAVAGARARLAAHGCRLVVTGPWPPYTFVADKA